MCCATSAARDNYDISVLFLMRSHIACGCLMCRATEHATRAGVSHGLLTTMGCAIAGATDFYGIIALLLLRSEIAWCVLAWTA